MQRGKSTLWSCSICLLFLLPGWCFTDNSKSVFTFSSASMLQLSKVHHTAANSRFSSLLVLFYKLLTCLELYFVLRWFQLLRIDFVVLTCLSISATWGLGLSCRFPEQQIGGIFMFLLIRSSSQGQRWRQSLQLDASCFCPWEFRLIYRPFWPWSLSFFIW